jgi:SAM-dependent methyltransferase/uncharacterized protein YbaR (Trm112 family)
MNRGFPVNLVALVRCQADGAPLEALGTIEQDDSPFILEGEVTCPSCNVAYQVRGGILELASAQAPMDPVNAAEVEARDAGAEGYDAHFSPTRNESEIRSTLAPVQVMNSTILDLGCGTGRVTRRLLQEARAVLAVDFSRVSLEVFAESLNQENNVGLVLADATQIVVAADSFDVVLSTEVLEHIPTSALRSRFFNLVRDCLKSDGVFVFTAYFYSSLARLSGAPREGFHASNIFFHRFSRSEIRAESRACFDVRIARPIQVPVPLVHKLRLSPAKREGVQWGPISRVAERMPFMNQFAQLILVVARPKK